MGTYPTYFSNHLALAKLPWLEVRDGRPALAEPLESKIIDIHSHLALTYLRRASVDLWKKHLRTCHYLPLERPVDLDVYANKNLSEDDLKRMKADLTWATATTSGMRETHTAANLLQEMDDLGITKTVVLPIDFPFVSRNAETFIQCVKSTDRLLSFGSVHPHAPNPGQEMERQKTMGARGIKVHSAIQMVAPDSPRAMLLYESCADLGLPVLWHCGPVGIEPRLGRHLCQVKNYWRPLLECERTTFILGHSGALQMEMGLELAKRHDNAYLDISCQSLTNVRRIVAEAPPERVLFGSDWPFYHQALPLAKVLIATEGDPSARRRILWENAARLFDIT